MSKSLALFAALAILAAPPLARAGAPEVVDATATFVRAEADIRIYDFTVTLRHADTGWEHYADRWDVLGPDGATLGERVLLHPHVDEQPFTRSLRGVAVPAGVETVSIRAHDSVHGDGPVLFELTLPSASD